VITLSLLRPLESTPAQSWTFEDEPVIRIGRAADNHVVLYSAVVSRRHVEVRRVDGSWEIVSLGANGTYVDEELIVQVPVIDGVVIRLARSGPQIQIRLGATALEEARETVSEERSATALT
jgi:pSer/pThr/pTyr-binding forkhead associated (FHA) protein